jgi:mannan endo-1,4-beta-mannosidase
MIKISIKSIFLLILTGIALASFSCSITVSESRFDYFISVKGNKLMEGEKEFRFISYNIPTLNFNEDEFEFSHLHAYSLPDEFELRDVFETVKQMGGKVVRLYTIPVKLASEPENTPTYVLAPNTFSEEAFKTMDLVLALANEYNVRIIFSLLNNWQWMGGRPQYAHFRGKTADEFWTDLQLIDDFKATVKYAINRTNTLTGIQYKNDKAIMCWETGNELSSPFEWTIEICRYIKSLDSNHLVMDGYNSSDRRPIREGSILEPSIDIIQSHHYEMNPADFIENVNRNIATINKRKPYLIGEFGFIGTPAIEQYLNKIIESDISGILIWGLRGHRSKGGFYWHSEPLGFGRYKSYHWPGFESGKEYDETNLMKIMREKAFQIDGKTPPPLTAPSAPELLPIDHVARINWKGSVGASSYDLFRSSSPDGPWNLTGYNLSDAAEQYFPFFDDRDAKIGETYYYRLIAKNQYGNSEPSKIAGPVKVESKALIDDMENFGELYYSSGEITPETSNDRKFKEDMFRLKGVEGNEMVYFVPGNIIEMKIYSYCKEDTVNLKFEISHDNQNYASVNAERMSYNDGKGDYDYWVPISYSFKTKNQNHYLKINFMRETQVGRLEIYYN